ncbi:aspartate/glutamate racemase family protein [Paenibacillus sp. H1-7]|uniref:aspartate/glutamate racemase family protein n=1 Tax=Paenibacillus sp. H1-7 TaxID=2282849 RepID=UPI001EF86F9E|nr:amino acid racemase [Paenibacillus sp. H1-7]ULL17060.1 aspartate/glutamate racemase family protein [Paenibacillus sp. H1-7]
MNEILGIVGGMGSHATASMFQQLINKSSVKKDQEYIEILIHNNTRIPDRTEAILNQGEDPLPELARSVKLLERCGAAVIVLACVTAHHFYDKLGETLQHAQLFNIIKETADFTCSMYPNTRTIGILATEGTCKSGLWQKEFNKRKMSTVILSDPHQETYFNSVVYGPKGIKAGYTNEELKLKLLEGCNKLRDMGAEAIIGACSELPILISKEDLQLPYIDSLEVTVEKLIGRYYGKSV